jgi:hypothetical protein
MHSRSLAKSAHRRQVLVSGLTAAILLVGCRQDSQPPASPIEVARQIVTARANRDTATIVSLTTPSQQTALQDLLLAVDEFRVQAIRLRSAVAIHIGGGISKACDLTHLTDHLALFSEQVELLDETITADRATVAFMLAGRLPTKRAEFTREAGQWRYDPGDLSSMQFAPAFRELATGLSRVSDAVEAETFEAKSTQENPEPLLNELRRRLEPGLKLMPKPGSRG